MAFPFVSEDTFDAGTMGGWTSETDTSSILDFPHYKTLAAQGLHPWRGSHALRLRLNGTAVGYLSETTDYDVAAAGTLSIWFSLLIGEDISLNATDFVTLFTLESAGPVQEASIGITNTAGVYQLFAGETGAAATRALTIVPNNKRWYQIEMVVVVDDGVGDNGTLAFYVDGRQIGATITGLDQAAITQASLGAVLGTAAGNAGTILIGGIIADDVRVFPRERFTQDSVWVTRDICAFVGPCTLDSASVTGTGTDAVMALLDTDIFESGLTDFSREPVVYIRNVTANDQSPGFNTPVEFKRGVYAQLTGTSPQGWISVKCGPPVKSGANYVDRGRMAN